MICNFKVKGTVLTSLDDNIKIPKKYGDNVTCEFEFEDWFNMGKILCVKNQLGKTSYIRMHNNKATLPYLPNSISIQIYVVGLNLEQRMETAKIKLKVGG